jgi:hypothetical protein
VKEHDLAASEGRCDKTACGAAAHSTGGRCTRYRTQWLSRDCLQWRRVSIGRTAQPQRQTQYDQWDCSATLQRTPVRNEMRLLRTTIYIE